MESKLMLENFYNYLITSKNFSKNTINCYYNDIKKVFDYVDEKNINFYIDEEFVAKYIEYLKNKNYSNTTISRIISSINIFNDFLFKNNLLKNKIKLDMKLNKNNYSNSELTIFSIEEIDEILNFKNKDFLSLRDKAIFELVYAIGIKPSDCISLLITDINLKIGYLKYKNSKNIYVTIPLNNQTILALEEYIEELKKQNFNNNFLFVSKLGIPLTRQGFWKIFKKRQTELNLEKELSPTTYRNSLAIHLLKAGINVSDVKDLLGLKSINSMKNYIEEIEKENTLKKVILQHPRNDIR